MANIVMQTFIPGIVRFPANETNIMHPDGRIEGGTALGASFGSGDDPGIAMFGCNELAMVDAQKLVDLTRYDG